LEPWVPFLPLALGLLLGWLMLRAAEKRDHRTWVLARAPSLPIRSLAEHDDAWLRGIVRLPHPLQCPWFQVPCAHFEYWIEKKVTRTWKDSQGKTHTSTSWDTQHREQDAVDFELDDGARIRVRGSEAEFDDLESLGPDYERSDLRHQARILPEGAERSVLGVKLEDGSFGRLREVPLLVMEELPDQAVRASERWEVALRVLGMAFLFAGVTGSVALFLGGDGRQHWAMWAPALGAGAAALVPVWALVTYNLFQRLRQQVHAGWHQVEVDLGVRGSLVPQLQSVLQGYQNHERGLLESLAAIRSAGSREQIVDREERAAGAMQRALLLVEKYPELKADRLFMDLHDRLWALEEKIATSRVLYDRIAKEWNDRVASFPSLLVARACGYRAAPFFALRDGDGAAENAPRPA
jgi:LemA protein